jgi:hypothetical protein
LGNRQFFDRSFDFSDIAHQTQPWHPGGNGAIRLSFFDCPRPFYDTRGCCMPRMACYSPTSIRNSCGLKTAGCQSGDRRNPTVACLENQAMCGSKDPNKNSPRLNE